jgi:hypothetical protein
MGVAFLSRELDRQRPPAFNKAFISLLAVEEGESVDGIGEWIRECWHSLVAGGGGRLAFVCRRWQFVMMSPFAHCLLAGRVGRCLLLLLLLLTGGRWTTQKMAKVLGGRHRQAILR